MKIAVLDGYALNPGDLSWERLRAFGDLTVYDRSPPDTVLERARDAEVLLTNKTSLPGSVLHQLPKLRYIGVLATGFNIVDVNAARSLGIAVTNIPSYGTFSVAQFTFALLLELCNRVGLHGDAVKAGEWSKSDDWCFTKSPQKELAGKAFGVVGFGRIGRQATSIAKAFGMKVIAVSSPSMGNGRQAGVTFVTREELFSRSDVVSLHCPLNEKTNRMINSAALALMKPSALLVNTSRGGLIDEQSLAKSLNEDRLAGAALDVLSLEPPTSDNPLLHAKNCLVTPHVAWASFEARSRLLKTAVTNLSEFLAGRAVNLVA